MNTKLKDIGLSRQKAHFIRHSYIEDMEKYLLALESQASANGIDVQWIDNEEELNNSIEQILQSKSYNKVCFDIDKKPQTLLEKKNFIREISIEDCENNSDVAEYLITRADFAVSDTGSIVLINKKSKNILNKVRNVIFVLDLNMVIPRITDLDTILNLYSLNHDKTILPNDIKIINQPYKLIQTDMMQASFNSQFSSEDVKLYLLLYNNGITNILEDEKVRESLYCIHCGLCQQVCPVYAQTKEYTPIELLKANCPTNENCTKDVFCHTTLCGNCERVCPVKIPFTDLFIREMEMSDIHPQGESGSSLLKDFSKRSKMNKLSNKFHRFFFLRKYFGHNRQLFNYYSSQQDNFFNVRWREAQKDAENDDED